MRLVPKSAFAGVCVLLAVSGVVLAQVPGSTGQSAASPPPSTAAISGVILDSTTQKPLPGAVVQINGAPAGPNGQIFRGERQIADEQGRFVFTDLPGNTAYTVSASKFGYLDGTYGRPNLSGPGAARRIVLAPGQWFRDVRVELLRPSAINGSIRDESGEPVAGVQVRLYAEVLVAGTRHLAGSAGTVTDDRGIYRIAGLTPGQYLVAVPSVQHAVPAGLSDYELSGTTPEAVATAESAGRESPLRRDPAFALDPGHRLVVQPNSPTPAPSAAGRPQVYPTVFYPGVRTHADAVPIQLKSGEDRAAVDVTLRPVPAFRVSGRLDGPAEAVGALTVRLLPTGLEGLGRGSETATAFTAADGTFTFLNVATGSYTLIASRTVSEYALRQAGQQSLPTPSAPGSRAGGGSSSAVFSGTAGLMFTSATAQGQPYQGRTAVTVGERDIRDVAVTMRAGITISGQTIPESTRSAAVPAGVPGLGIVAEPANGDPSLGQPRSVRERNTGSASATTEFTLQGVLPGAYLLRPVGGGGMVKSIMWEGRDYTNTPLDATTGRDITGVVITLTYEFTTITGAVRDQMGQIAGSAAVIVFPVERAQWSQYGIQPVSVRGLNASTTGTYTVRHPAGTYFVVAVPDHAVDRWKDPAFLEAASRVAMRITIAWGETKTQDLTLQVIK